MANERSYRIRPKLLASDRLALMALQKLTTYAPFNPDYQIGVLVGLDNVVDQAKQNENNIQSMLTAARDATMAAEWALHDGMIGAKSQALAQYGPSSDVIQSLGLKKKSKYRRPVPHTEKKT